MTIHLVVFNNSRLPQTISPIIFPGSPKQPRRLERPCVGSMTWMLEWRLARRLSLCANVCFIFPFCFQKPLSRWTRCAGEGRDDRVTLEVLQGPRFLAQWQQQCKCYSCWRHPDSKEMDSKANCLQH